MLHAPKLKQWKETLVVRYSIETSSSKSQSENTKDTQEMPSIKLLENLQKFMKAVMMQEFKVFRTDMKDEWEKIKEEWLK